MWGDDPPFLTVGTEVSAKYKGAFCEAKVRKVVRSVKCKVTFKLGLGTLNVTDDQIRGGTLRVGSVCEVKHPEKKEFVEAVINKIQDCSQYTVVFDDGDITTLRRTALCLKSGRHFAESETLDQLPLTHPEHFSNPVIGGRKGRRSRQAQDDSSDDDDVPKKGKKKNEKEADIGKVVCVELGDKKKQKDNWFPGLVVAPTAQDTVRIRVKDEYLVRSFKDGRYFTVPKKEATEFTREIGSKVDNHTLKAAVEKALQYLDRDELPPHWDRDLLFGLDESSGNSDSDGALDSDSSDDEPREEKDHFVAQLYKFMDDRGTPINRGPTIGSKDVDLYKLFKVVHKLGGYNRVTNHNQWKTISQKLGFGQGSTSTTNLVKQSYKKFLHSFEDFYRKLGCTMVNHPRGHRSRHRTGRSLIRDRDRATPTIIPKEKEKEKEKEKKEEKPAPKVEETTVEKVPCEKEEGNSSEDKKECPKVKDTVKKNKAREEKSENQTKAKAKDPVQPSPAEEKEEKDNRPRNRKDNKPPVLRSEEPVKEEKNVIPVPVIKQEPETSDDSKSRETKLKTRDLKPKVKPNEKTKVKEEKPKVPEEDKVEEVKKKSEKKPETEEAEKVRPKPKDDIRPKKEGIPVHDVRPPKDLVNRPARLRKEDEAIPHLKKRGRKRKDMDEKPKPEEATGHLASHVTVCVGDKLKVYYGPTHESKVTYEAKVLEIEEDVNECLYLVHYTGWNTRYDEWIKRGRIADNLSWTPTRAKRQRQQQSQHKVCRPSQGKRGRPSGLARGNDGLPNPPRSTTPSSVTSSSSQNKSPASRLTPRSSRSFGDGQEFRRRTRRMSGHTDISVASDTESEDFPSDLESEVAQTRSRTTELRKSTPVAFGSQSHADSSSATPDSSPVATPPAVKEEPVTPTSIRKKTSSDVGGSGSSGSGSSSSGDIASTSTSISKPVLVESVVDETTNKTEPVFKGRVFSDFSTSEKRRSRRGKVAIGSLSHASNAKAQPESKLNVSNEGEESCEPKGRDFDLNQIRSELKGIEKTVKVTQDPPSSFCGGVEESKEKGKIKSSSLMNWDITERASDMKIKPKKEIKEEEKHDSKIKIKELEQPPPAEEDVYEFKDTEPLELEVRKRDALSLSDSKSLPRRSAPSSRHFEPFSLSNESTISSGSSHLSILGSSPGPSTSRLSSSKSPRKRVINTSSKDSEMSNEGGKKLRAASKKKTPLAESKGASHLIKDVPKTESQPSNLSKPSKSSILSANHKMEETCPTSFLKTVVSPLSVTQLSSTGLSRLQTSLTVGTVATSDNPSSPPLLSLPDVSEDDDNVDSTNVEEKSQLGPLSLFSETHDDGDDDHEDRLVISESDDMVTEIAEPLFSYQQRDHEDLFPTLVTSAAVVTSAPTGTIMKTEDPPCLSSVEGTPTIFQDFGSTILESNRRSSLQQSTQRGTNRSSSHCVLSSPSDAQDGEDVIKDLLDHQHDYGDDSINAAICRVLDRSIMDEDDDTSGEMELFCQKQIPGITSSVDIVNSSLSFQSTSSSTKIVSKGPIEHKEMCVSFHDSDSAGDSSDEEDQRLVIDPTEDDGNSQTPSRSSPLSNNSLSICIDNLQETQNQDSSCDPDTPIPSFEKSKKETDVTPTVIVSCSSSMLQDNGKEKVGVSVRNANEIDKSEGLPKQADMGVDDTTKVQPTDDRKSTMKFENDEKELISSIKKSDGVGRSAITPVIVKMENSMTTAESRKSSEVKTTLKENVLLSEATKEIMPSVGSKATDSAKTVIPIRSSIPVKADFSKGISRDTTSSTTSSTMSKSMKSTNSHAESNASSEISGLSKYRPFCFSSSEDSSKLIPEHDKSLKLSKDADKDTFVGTSSTSPSVSPAAIVISNIQPTIPGIIGSRVTADNSGIMSSSLLSSEKSVGESKSIKSVTCESTGIVNTAALATVSSVITVPHLAHVTPVIAVSSAPIIAVSSAPIISASTVISSLSTSTTPIIVSPSIVPFTLNVSSVSTTTTIIKPSNIAVTSQSASVSSVTSITKSNATVSSVTSITKTNATVADSGILVSAPPPKSIISKTLASSALNVGATPAISSAAPISLCAAPVVLATYAVPPVSTPASLLMRVASPNSTTTAPGSVTVTSVPKTVSSTISSVTKTTSSIVTTLTSSTSLSASTSITATSTFSTVLSTASSSTSSPIINSSIIVSTVPSTIPATNTTTPIGRSSISVTCSSITSSSGSSSTTSTASSNVSAPHKSVTSSKVTATTTPSTATSSATSTVTSTATSTASATATPFATQTVIPVTVEKATNSVGATSINSPTVSEGTSPVTILVGTSPALGTTNTTTYKYIISSCNTDDSTSSGSGVAVDSATDVNLISESLATSSLTPPVCPVVTSISTCACTSAVTTTVTSIPSTTSSVQSTVIPSTSTASQPNSNLKIVCDAIKHSDSASVIALTSLSLGETDILSGDIRLDSRSDDADSQLLGSLLCQETIPGSPAQITDGGFEESVQESNVLVLEMPFASVPASNCDDPNSSVPLSVPMSVPLSLPMVNVSTLSDSKSIEKVDGIEPSVVDAPAAVPSGPEVVTSQVPAASSSHHVLVIPSASEAAPVMENTPPTTPDSSLSTISGSPREDHRTMSPGLDNESSKSHRDSFEMDLDSCPEDSPLNVEVANSCKNRLQALELMTKKELELDKDGETSPKKRRRSRKRSESENKKIRCSSNKSVRPNGGTGSDSDDTSENSALDCTHLPSSESTLSSKSPRPSKYNFYVELDPELDGSQRIALLQQKLQELRKTYMNVKAELACIDRRRKKLRRREREVEKTKQEVTCS